MLDMMLVFDLSGPVRSKSLSCVGVHGTTVIVSHYVRVQEECQVRLKSLGVLFDMGSRCRSI